MLQAWRRQGRRGVTLRRRRLRRLGRFGCLRRPLSCARSCPPGSGRCWGIVMSLMFQPFKKYADFNGRARRLEYWLVLAVLLHRRSRLRRLRGRPAVWMRWKAVGWIRSASSTCCSRAVLVPSLGRRLPPAARHQPLGLVDPDRPDPAARLDRADRVLPAAGHDGPNRWPSTRSRRRRQGADAAEVFRPGRGRSALRPPRRRRARERRRLFAWALVQALGPELPGAAHRHHVGVGRVVVAVLLAGVVDPDAVLVVAPCTGRRRRS